MDKRSKELTCEEKKRRHKALDISLSRTISALLRKAIRVSDVEPMHAGALGYTSNDGGIHVAHDNPFFDGLEQTVIETCRIGIAIHEALHKAFTPFQLNTRMINSYPVQERGIVANISNICEDPRIEHFARQIVGGSKLKALEYVIKLTFIKSPAIDEIDNAYAQWANAMIQFGDMGIIKGHFTKPEAKEVFLKTAPILYDVILEPNARKSLKKIKEIVELSRPLWADSAEKTREAMEAMKELMEKLGKSEMNGSGSPMAGEPSADGGEDGKSKSRRATMGGTSKSSTSKGATDASGAKEAAENAKDAAKEAKEAAESAKEAAKAAKGTENEAKAEKAANKAAKAAERAETAAKEAEEAAKKAEDAAKSGNKDAEEAAAKEASKAERRAEAAANAARKADDEANGREPEEVAGTAEDAMESANDAKASANAAAESAKAAESNSEIANSLKDMANRAAERAEKAAAKAKEAANAAKEAHEAGNLISEAAAARMAESAANTAAKEADKAAKIASGEYKPGQLAEDAEMSDGYSGGESNMDGSDASERCLNGAKQDYSNCTEDELDDLEPGSRLKPEMINEIYELTPEDFAAITTEVDAAIKDLEKLESDLNKQEVPMPDFKITSSRFGDCTTCLNRKIKVSDPEYAAEQYSLLLEKLRPGINSLTARLKNIFQNDLEIKEYRGSGKINYKRLTSSRMTARVFDKNHLPSEKANLAVMLLVDESGSMSGTNARTAKETAIALAEVMNNLHVPTYIIGFTADCGADAVHNHYTTWRNSRAERLSLLDITARSNNFDGYSIRYGGELLKRVNAEHKLMIVVSDGSPACYAYRSGTSGIADTKDAIRNTRNFADVLGVLVGNYCVD